MLDFNEKRVKWAQVLNAAISTPGMLSAAYAAFHNYSLGNQILAMIQCAERDEPVGPLATFEQWKRKGRYVRKGQKAITLCMPIMVTVKRDEDSDTAPAAGEKPARRQIFVYKAQWFTVHQTDGQAVEPMPAPGFEYDAALLGLGVERVTFEMPSGNCQGYATRRNGQLQVAISPVAAMPHKTFFHEVAHCLLHFGEADGQIVDSDELSTAEREMEAEATAMLCLDALDLPGAEYCRGYIQNWARGREITDKMARRVISAAEKILKAGAVAASVAEPVMSDVA